MHQQCAMELSAIFHPILAVLETAFVLVVVIHVFRIAHPHTFDVVVDLYTVFIHQNKNM
jgi:hypothetical protein